MSCSKIPLVARVIASDFGARPILGEFLYTDFQLIAISGLSSIGVKTNTFLFIKIDRVIVTQVGFCVISPWSLSRFLSNHQKALLRKLLHLHSNFQFIP